MPFVAHRAFGWQPLKIAREWKLRTIPEGWAYPICNTCKCDDCKFLFCDIRPDDSEMAALYDDYRGRKYTDLREYYEPGYSDYNDALLEGITYLDEVEAFLRPELHFPVSVLDWGGDDGINTPFKDSSTFAHIYDIGNKPAIYGEKVREPLTHYNLIVCSNVLEHVSDPIDTLHDIKLSMNCKTILYIEVPAENTQEPKYYWHEHINMFTVDTLGKLVQRAGLWTLKYRQLKMDDKNRIQFACTIK